MPDLLSHVLFGLIICEIAKRKKKSLILIGTILPDIITKLYLIGYFIKLDAVVVGILDLFHNPIPLFFVAVLISLLFKDVFSSIYLIGAGALSHILLDGLNIHFLGGIRYLFPFSWNIFRINGFWPDQYWVTLVPFFLVYLFIKIFNYYYVRTTQKN